ncbi:YbjP/YqhG family protein [Chryseobacterium sp. PBS4-4]|uniref:YbjP/YqhG family protein n=1 Tax=Chryseobacterium edaphi TaxID=2976532 RepID=A0ABT2W992_9FLAO|nr:YbjP/YqhG family protein [Chryseobacterium edaphi]MCU7618775.1 YbjP/YqhG family protein [Chryseobacterium edaphi]
MNVKKLVIFLLIAFSLQACSQTPTSKPNAKAIISQNNDEIKKELKFFYIKYFSEMEHTNKSSEKNLDLLRQKYMTPELYKKLKNIDLDYDPIINGQDIDPNWKKTLSIKYVKERNLYEVCTVNGFDNSKNCTFLKVEKSDTGYKIYDIKVNNISSVISYSDDVEENDGRSENVNTEYSANGEWRINCGDGVASITIKDKEASLIVLSNQIYIELAETERYSFEKGIAYKLKNVPEDSGGFGTKLPWKEYLNNQPIAYIKIVDENTLKFYWYGFYNNKTNKREMTDSEFNQESKYKEIVLKKCRN